MKKRKGKVPPKKFWFVTPGEAASMLFQRMLEPELGDAVDFYAAGFGASVIVRSGQLARKGNMVAIVVNVESCEPVSIRSERLTCEALLSRYAPSDQWKMYLMVPQWETLLFHPDMLPQVAQCKPTLEQLQRARTQPRLVLQELRGVKEPQLYNFGHDMELARHLRTVDTSPLRSLSLYQDILTFFRSIPEDLCRMLGLPPYEEKSLPDTLPPGWMAAPPSPKALGDRGEIGALTPGQGAA